MCGPKPCRRPSAWNTVASVYREFVHPRGWTGVSVCNCVCRCDCMSCSRLPALESIPAGLKRRVRTGLCVICASSVRAPVTFGSARRTAPNAQRLAHRVGCLVGNDTINQRTVCAHVNCRNLRQIPRFQITISGPSGPRPPPKELVYEEDRPGGRGGSGSLKILAGVLVHRAARPLRVSVSCGSGWPVQYLVFRFN